MKPSRNLQRHGRLGLHFDTAKEIKQRPIDGDLEQLLDETRDKRTQLEDAAQAAGKREYDKVMESYEEYTDLAFEAEQLVVGLTSRMEMIKDRKKKKIKDRKEFNLRRGSVKVHIELEEKMLQIEQQKAEIEHLKLQIEAERLNPEKEKLKKKLKAETAKPGTKPNNVKFPKLEMAGILGFL